MRKFTLLTGYPRSRTCWLSEVLTVHGHSFAYHEASIGSGSCAGWRDKLFQRPEQYVIDCNASTIAFLHQPDFQQAMMGMHYVLIMRDKETCKASYEDFLGDLLSNHSEECKTAAWEEMERNYNSLYNDPECIKIPYESLDDEMIVKRIAEHVAPFFPWDSERFDQLRKKKIVQNIDAFVKVL